MTPQELDAIRARDADSRSQTPGDLTYVTPTQRAAYNDRRALLAEVDRLQQGQAHAVAVAASDFFAGGKEAERARIRAEVEGLRSWGTIHTCWDDHEGEGGTHADGAPCPDDPREVVDRAAVLAIVEGTDVRE